LFTQHVISLWRDTSSELWTPVHSFTFILPSTANTVYVPQALFYFTANKHLFPHYTSNLLLSANQWDWQPHYKLGQSSLVVLCAGSTLLLAPKPRTDCFLALLPKSASNNIRKLFLSPTGRLNLGFITEEKLTVVLIIPSSWGFPTGPVRHQCPINTNNIPHARYQGHYQDTLMMKQEHSSGPASC
jgi:hypothetical protein